MTTPSSQRTPAPDGVSLSQRAEHMLDRALEHSALPESVQQLLELTRRDRADVGSVVDALALNPSLVAVVLRIANSPIYGQQRAISDLRRAVGLLGMQELHDVVAGVAMMAAFSSADPLSERMQASAVLSASIARVLASKLGLNASSASTAYLSGLMCELGALACLALDPSYAELYDPQGTDVRARVEREVARYGGPTPHIGGRILAASALPTEVAQAVATTGLEPGGHGPSLRRVVAFARVATAVLIRAQEHGDALRLRAELVDAAESVGLEAVDPELLFSASLTAAMEAELTLRGELGLMQTAPSNDVAPVVAPAAGRTTKTSLAVYAGLAAAAALAALAWLIGR